MAYQVIARKYRPQRFQDVIGQEHVTQTLANAIQQSRIAHAYLFVGPRGTGKTTIARIFAKCLNCTDGPKADFPADDPRCLEIAEGRSLDVLEIDGASNRGIDEIRELRDTVKYVPATSRYKIYIIDEVHMLTKEAFNALLKTLEEPPEHVKFMFATTEPEKVLATILSRCQRFDLRRIPVPLIASHLRTIAGQERVEIDGAALHAVARGADGCMRDAESALDQLISFCGDRIVESDVLSMFGLTAQGQIMALGGHLFRGEASPALNELNQLAKQGKDLGRLLADLLAHCRNLLLFLIGGRNTDLLEVTETEAEALANQAEETDADALTRIMEVLTEAEGGYRGAASKRIFLEIALLRAIQARQAVPLGAVLERLEQCRNQSPPGGAESKSTPRAASPRPGSDRPEESAAPRNSRQGAANSGASDRRASTPVEASEPADEEASPAPTSLEGVWRALLELVGRASAFTRSYLIQAHPVSLTDRMLTLGIDPEFSDQLELLNNQRTLTLLQTKLKELGRPGMSVRFVKADAPPEASPSDAPQAEPAAILEEPAGTPPAPSAAETRRDTSPASAEKAPDFKNDPLIQKALELFKGQIVQVRG